MEHTYHVRVYVEDSNSLYRIELTGGEGQSPQVYGTQGGLTSNEVPRALLKLLSDRGERFVGTIPDFHAQRFGDTAFFVVAHPLRETTDLSPYDLSSLAAVRQGRHR